MKAGERRLRFTVPPDKAGRPLLAFLSARFASCPEDAWRERVADGRVRIDGAPARADHPLATGELIEYLGWDLPEPPVPEGFGVVYRDGHLWVVDKPAGLPCHPGGRYFLHTLTERLRRAVPPPAAPLLVNRIDRETSGLVLVALSRGAAARLQRQFVRRQVGKRYVVLVEGRFPAACEADGWIVPDTASPVRKRRRFLPAAAAGAPPAPGAGAKRAVTRFRLRCARGEVSEVEAEPLTGRLHQVRATLEALGHPVVGDKLYGRDPGIYLRFCDGALTAADRRLLRMDRQALHAAWLRIRHPAAGAWMEFTAPLPADLRVP